jgi:Ca2+-binding EF-hand superfamily protein
MITHFDRSEILKYKKRFLELTNGTEKMSKEEFMSNISVNPLKERVALVFGYDQVTSMNFRSFLIGLSYFNCHGNNDTKLKVAFRLQDIDDDGVINKDDLKRYLELVTPPPPTNIDDNTLLSEDVFYYDYCVDEVFKEASIDGDVITFNDFSRIIATTDFQTKLYLNL